MCGIVGVLGIPGAARVVRQGLERLEYRGYDSAGIAWATPDGIDLQKAVGRVVGPPPTPKGAETLALGHTRWATHGGVTQANAHPHLDATGRYAVVHNGTIEGAQRLRSQLAAAGHVLRSETDSEVLVHLYERARRTMDPAAALEDVLAHLRGSWAFVILDQEAGALAFAVQGAPLLAAFAPDGALLLASDASAVLAHTRRVAFLDDGDHGIATAQGMTVRGADGRERPLTPRTLDWDLRQAERAGYPHFMLKEIHDAPTAVNQCLAGRLRLDPVRVELGLAEATWRGVRRVRLVGAGSSLHAALLGRHFIESWSGLPAEALGAAEAVDRPWPADDGLLTIALSQSGETYDTLEAVRHAQRHGARVVAITNHQGSTLERITGAAIQLRVGPEVGVAATKTVLGQATVLALVALELARQRGLPDANLRPVAAALERLPRVLEGILERAPAVEALARHLGAPASLFFLGRGAHAAVAQETALKVKEVAYLHAEALGAAELKHGPFALLEPATPCVFLGHDALRLVNPVREVAARGAPVALVAESLPEDLEGVVAHALLLPLGGAEVASIGLLVAGQLLAYALGTARGCPVDRPRNLAKSVTVA